MSSSANETLPATALPSAVTDQASFVARRSIDSLNRTDSTASCSTFDVPCVGRNRTTAGAAAVLIVRDGVSASGEPDVSERAPSVTVYSVDVASGSAGLNQNELVPAADAMASRAPRSGGSMLSALRTSPIATDRSKLKTKPVVTATSSPAGAVVAICAVVAWRVRKTARAGTAIGRPVSPSAPARTETV